MVSRTKIQGLNGFIYHLNTIVISNPPRTHKLEKTE